MATKKIRYVGGYPAVSVPLPDGSVVEVQRNHQVELPEDVARSLHAQADWEYVKDRDKDKDEPATPDGTDQEQAPA